MDISRRYEKKTLFSQEKFRFCTSEQENRLPGRIFKLSERSKMFGFSIKKKENKIDTNSSGDYFFKNNTIGKKLPEINFEEIKSRRYEYDRSFRDFDEEE